MKVLNLTCSHGHAFEGWFASTDDFGEQVERGLVECPLCGDTAVTRLPSAPRVHVSKPRETAPAVPAEHERQAQQHWLRAMRQVLESTEDVGERFPEEARRIHYGETQERGIRGKASREDADALRDEGIDVVVLPLPPALKGPVQ
jgi:hypothetical protein